jgi:hypothetical protein
MLVPLLDGLLFERVGPWTFLLVNMVGCVVASIVFASFFAVGHLCVPRRTSLGPSAAVSDCAWGSLAC